MEPVKQEQQVCFDQAALEDWFRGRLKEIVSECLEKFPRLERFQAINIMAQVASEVCRKTFADKARELKVKLDEIGMSAPEE